MLFAILAIIALLVLVFVVLPIIGVALWLVISTAVVGLVIGALARLVVPGRQAIGLLATIGMGIAGSLVGTAIGHVAGLGGFFTFLLEVGVAAVGVVALNRRHTTAVGSGGSRALGR